MMGVADVRAFRPVHSSQSERLVSVVGYVWGEPDSDNISPAEFGGWKDQTKTLEHVAPRHE